MGKKSRKRKSSGNGKRLEAMKKVKEVLSLVDLFKHAKDHDDRSTVDAASDALKAIQKDDNILSDTDESIEDSDDEHDDEDQSVLSSKDPFIKLVQDLEGINSSEEPPDTDDSNLDDDGNDDNGQVQENAAEEDFLDIPSVEIHGKTFRKNQCYGISYEGKSNTTLQIIFGILGFTSEKEAMIVPFKQFKETYVGKLQKRLYPNKKSELPCPKVQYLRLPKAARKVQLRHLVSAEEIDDMYLSDWTWAVKPRRGRNFGIYDTREKIRIGKREKICAGDLYCCSGGQSAGMQANGFHVKIGVESNLKAALAFLSNHGGIGKLSVSTEEEFLKKCRYDTDFLSIHLEGGGTGVLHGTVEEFLDLCRFNPKFKKALGKIHYIHLSPPCRGYSSENRRTLTGPEHPDDAKNNQESLQILKVVEYFRPLVVTFENVVAMWKRQFDKYRYPIYFGLLKFGYQFEQACLAAQDYGDPQIRQRLFIVAAQAHIPLPKIPPKTHGQPDPFGNVPGNLHPFVTSRDSLRKYEGLYPEKETPLQRDGKYELQADKPSPALKASKAPLHYFENRPLVTHETHAIAFGPGHVTVGDDNEKNSQAGNAIPICLSTESCRETRSVLSYEYLNYQQEGSGTVDESETESVVYCPLTPVASLPVHGSEDCSISSCEEERRATKKEANDDHDSDAVSSTKLPSRPLEMTSNLTSVATTAASITTERPVAATKTDSSTTSTSSSTKAKKTEFNGLFGSDDDGDDDCDDDVELSATDDKKRPEATHSNQSDGDMSAETSSSTTLSPSSATRSNNSTTGIEDASGDCSSAYGFGSSDIGPDKYAAAAAAFFDRAIIHKQSMNDNNNIVNVGKADLNLNVQEIQILNLLGNLYSVGICQPKRGDVHKFSDNYENTTESGFEEDLDRLQKKEYIEYTENEQSVMKLTIKGREYVNCIDRETLSNVDFQRRMKDLLPLTAGEILDAISDGREYNRLVLAKKLGYDDDDMNTVSVYGDIIIRMTTLGFLDYPKPEFIQLSDTCFPQGRPNSKQYLID